MKADLQTAVVVANDLKLEAQSEIERMGEENAALRLRIVALKEEVERLRLRTKHQAHPARHNPSTPPAPSASSSLSVRSLIESLEKPSTRAPSPRLGASARHSVPEPAATAGLSKSSTNLSGSILPSRLLGHLQL